MFNEYQESLPNSPIPRCETVYRIVKSFEKMGSVNDSKRTGHSCSVHAKRNSQWVAQAFFTTPAQSVWKVSQELDLLDHFLQWKMKDMSKSTSK